MDTTSDSAKIGPMTFTESPAYCNKVTLERDYSFFEKSIDWILIRSRFDLPYNTIMDDVHL